MGSPNLNLSACLLHLLLFAALGQGIDWTVPDVVGSLRNVGSSIIDTKTLPTPQGLLEGSKNLIAGYPFEYVSSSINFLCELSNTITTPVKLMYSLHRLSSS